MELRRAFPALLRTAQHPMPSTHLSRSTLLHQMARSNPSQLSFHAIRSLSTTSSMTSQQAAAKQSDTGAADDKTTEQQPPRGPASRSTRALPPTNPPKRRDPLSFLSGTHRAPPSPQPTTVRPTQNPTTTATDFLDANASNPALDYLSVKPRSRPPPPTNSKTSFTDLAALLAGLHSNRSPSTTGSPRGSPYNAVGGGGPSRINTANMLSPNYPLPYDPTTQSSFPAVPGRMNDLDPPSFRIGPSLGRTVEVAPERGFDVARAFRQVDIKCGANAVRADFMRQRFHERGGLKRKRLVMSRWRKRFKEAFRATVKRVEDMRRKGW